MLPGGSVRFADSARTVLFAEVKVGDEIGRAQTSANKNVLNISFNVVSLQKFICVNFVKEGICVAFEVTWFVNI